MKKNNKETKYINKIMTLDFDTVQNTQIDKAQLLEPLKDTKQNVVITGLDTDFTDCETVLEYQPDEHSERKQILVYKTRLICYLCDSAGQIKSNDTWKLDIGTKRPNYAKTMLALKKTQRHFNINGKLYPIGQILPNYIDYTNGIINTYEIYALEKEQ